VKRVYLQLALAHTPLSPRWDRTQLPPGGGADAAGRGKKNALFNLQRFSEASLSPAGCFISAN
jgi:hypothetical protein